MSKFDRPKSAAFINRSCSYRLLSSIDHATIGCFHQSIMQLSAAFTPLCQSKNATSPLMIHRLKHRSRPSIHRCHQSMPSIGPIDRCHRSVPSIDAIDRSHRSMPSIGPIDRCHRSVPSIDAIDRCHRSVPSIDAIDRSHRSVPSIDAIDRCRTSAIDVVQVLMWCPD